MTIWNLGSVNADLVYRVPHLPGPGETLAATAHQKGLGGKGANMSVAAVRAGSHVEHIGAVGTDGLWMRDRLQGYGVGVRNIAEIGEVSGHAIVALDPKGENQIIIFPASNLQITELALDQALNQAKTGDIAVLQNETNAQATFAKRAMTAGLRVAYAAAPFSVEAVQAVLPFLDLLILNDIEARQLEAALDRGVATLPVHDIVVTRGADGCQWIETDIGETHSFPAWDVDVVDTTGAGDTFTGYLLAGLDQGLDLEQALRLALRAGAVMVTRLGTADVIPTLAEIDDYFAQR